MVVGTETKPKDPRQAPPSAPLSDSKMLGSRGPYDYREYRGREYQLGRRSGDPSERGKRPGEQWFSEVVSRDDDGYEFKETRFYLGTEVPSGEYAALVAADEAKRARAAEREKPRILNAFARYPAILGRRPERVAILEAAQELVPLTTTANDDDLTWLAQRRRDRPPGLIVSEGRAPAETWAEAINVLAKWVTLDADSGSGQLRRWWRSGRLIPEVAAIVDRFEPGFRSVLTGHPLKCVVTIGCPRNADRDADGGIHWCGICDGQELHLEAEEVA